MATRKILVLDDEENIGRSLRLILEREGYGVVLCNSVAQFNAVGGRADVYLLEFGCRMEAASTSSARSR